MPRPEKLPSTPTDAEMKEREDELAIIDAASWGTDNKDLEPLKDSPALNKLLLKNARRTPNEIEALTGIPAAEVAERLTYLLDNTTIRDDLMEEKLLLREVSMLVNDIRERMARFNVEDEGWASMARVQLQAIKTLLEQVDKRRKAVDGQLAVVNKMQADMFTEAIRINNDLTVRSIAEKYGLEEEAVYAEWEDNFPKAVAMLESKVQD